LGSQAQPLQAVRTSARVSAEVSALSHLLPSALARRLHLGRDQSELVALTTDYRSHTNVNDRSNRGYAHSDPQRNYVAARSRRDAGFEVESRNRPHPQVRGLYQQLQSRRGRRETAELAA